MYTIFHKFTIVILESNSLGIEGAKRLAWALMHTHTLETLDLCKQLSNNFN